MGKRRRQRVSTGRDASARPKGPSKKAPTLPGELKPAERLEDRLTVFWMLTTLFTLATVALGAAAFLYDASLASAEGERLSGTVYDYARFATAVLSLLAFATTPVVLWMRQVAPPRAITLFVVATATVGLSWALLSGPLGDPSRESAPANDADQRTTSP